jgi:hypothetical protein
MKMSLTIESAKSIFELLDDDEEVGILMFDEIVDVIEEMKPKSAIGRQQLFSRLDEIEPRGKTDFGLGLSVAISMFQNCSDKARNQRILFLTDACPTAGDSIETIREMAEKAFVESNGHLGVSYWGIGLSFDQKVCAELSRAHSTSVSSLSTSAELQEILTKEFNYLVSPSGFDVRIGLKSEDFEIAEVYGGDSDCQKSGSVLEFRTLMGSAVGVEGVKGAAVIIHLSPLREIVGRRSSVEIWFEWKPFGEMESERKSFEYFLNEEATLVTEKAYALSVYYQTMLKVLPESNVRKDEFTQEEEVMLRKLQRFLKSQRNEILIRIENEVKIVDNLIVKHCKTQEVTEH